MTPRFILRMLSKDHGVSAHLMFERQGWKGARDMGIRMIDTTGLRRPGFYDISLECHVVDGKWEVHRMEQQFEITEEAMPTLEPSQLFDEMENRVLSNLQ